MISSCSPRRLSSALKSSLVNCARPLSLAAALTFLLKGVAGAGTRCDVSNVIWPAQIGLEHMPSVCGKTLGEPQSRDKH